MREGSVAEHTQRRSLVGPAIVGPDDPRYGDLVGRGSRRFAGKPDYVRVVCSTEQVVEAVQDAVREQLRKLSSPVRHLAVISFV